MLYAAQVLALTAGSTGTVTINPQARYITRVLVNIDTPSPLVVWSLTDRAGGNFLPRQAGKTLPLLVGITELKSKEVLFSDPPEVVVTVVNGSGATVNVITMIEMDPNPNKDQGEILAALESLGAKLDRLTGVINRVG